MRSKTFLFILLFMSFFKIAAGEWIRDGDELNVNSDQQAANRSITFFDYTPYVAFRETSPTNGKYQIYVKHFDGKNWIQDGGSLSKNSEYDSGNPSITIAWGRPYVAWHENNAEGIPRIQVKRWNNNSWEMIAEDLNVSPSNAAYFPVIASANGNTPFAVWREIYDSTARIYIKYYDGINWIQTGSYINVTLTSGHWAGQPEMAFYQGGSLPVVVWSDYNDIGESHYYAKMFNGSYFYWVGGQINNSHLYDFGYAPGIACKGEMYVLYPENGMVILAHYNSINGWEEDASITSFDYGPQPGNVYDSICASLGNINNTLCGTWTEGGIIQYAQFNGTSWSCDTAHPITNTAIPSNCQPKLFSNGNIPCVSWHTGNPVQGGLVYFKHENTLESSFVKVSTTHGIQNSTVTLNFHGRCFTQLPTICRLVRNGTEIVNGTNVQIINSRCIRATFDMRSASPGVYTPELKLFISTHSLPNSFFNLASASTNRQWRINVVQQMDLPSIGGTFAGLAIGDIDRDGNQEIAVANRNIKLSMLKNSGGSWNTTTLYQGTSPDYYSHVILADGDNWDNEGLPEVIGGSLANNIRGVTGANWNSTTSDKIYGLAAGDADNDGRNEVYAACANGNLYQYKNANSAWSSATITGPGQALYSAAVGDGNGDGTFEVYATSLDHNLYAFSYNGTYWSMTPVGSGTGEMYGLEIADGNHDGAPEIYTTNSDGSICQFKWQVTAWEKTVVGQVTGKLYAVACNDGENRGVDDLYAGGEDGHLYQFQYENNAWVKHDLGAASSQIFRLAIGDADNDNQFEIYTLGEDNKINQFKIEEVQPTPVPTATPQSVPDFKGQIIDPKYFYVAPNPSQSVNVNFRFFLRQSAEVEIRIYTPQGSHVLTKSFNLYPQGWNTCVWNASGMANGVYFYIVEAKANGVTEKLKVKKLALIK